MTSKQRVLTAFARREPDRVPIDYAANPGIDRRLKEHFGLAADDTEGLRQALGVDIRGVHAPYAGPRLHQDIPERDVVVDDWGIHRRKVQHESGEYLDYCDFPLRDADEETIANWPMPDPDLHDYDTARRDAERFADYAVFVGGAGLGCVINTAGFWRGMEQVFVDLMTDDPAGLLLIDRFLDIQYETTRRTLEACEGAIDFMYMGEDLGTQEGPIISIKLFKRHIAPRHQRFIDLAKQWNLPVMLHTCGSSSWTYDEYAQMGIDVVDTLQPEARDMAPEYLKHRFGDRLAFHGCISTAGPVAKGTVEETVDYCRHTLDVMMPGGGYCFAPTHSLQDNSPTENVLAMYEVAREYGRY